MAKKAKGDGPICPIRSKFIDELLERKGLKFATWPAVRPTSNKKPKG